MMPIRLEVGVGLAGGLPVLDAVHRRPELVGPHGLDAETHAHLFDGHLLHEAHERDVGAVAEDVARGVRHLDGLTGELHVDHAEGGEGALGRHLDFAFGGDAVGGARAPGADVDLAAHGALLPDDLALGDALQESGLGETRRVVVLEADGPLDDRSFRVLSHQLPSGSKQAMELMSGTLSWVQRTFTRMPVDIFDSSPASTAWSMPVSAPSSLIRAQAKGLSRGWPGRGSVTHAHVVTVPASATSTNSLSVSPVYGSYSVGGTITLPSEPLMPCMRCSPRPAKKRSMTGPTLRVYVYSISCGARSTSLVAI